MAEDRIVRVVRVSFEPEHYAKILDTARGLDMSVDSVIRAVVNTSVRRHFEGISVAPSEEVSGDG